MRTFKIATVTALSAAAALTLAAPMASASDTACDPATAAAVQAESDYKAALADYQKTVDGGGHPGQAERDNVDQLKQKADSAASEAQRICGDQVMDPTTKPKGAMHTGLGGTSTDDDASVAAIGAVAVAAAGAGVLVVRRRRQAGEH